MMKIFQEISENAFLFFFLSSEIFQRVNMLALLIKILIVILIVLKQTAKKIQKL